jgi:hypothetical protein
MTIPLTTIFWVRAEVDGMRLAPFKSRLRWLGRLRHRTLAILIRVGRNSVNMAARRARKLEFDRM